MSQRKNGSNSVGTLYRVVLGLWERWCFAMIMLIYIYSKKGQGEAYILTFQINVHNYISVSKLRSGFAWWDYFASPHHAN